MEDAISYLHRAVELEPKFFDPYCKLGEAYLTLRRPDRAATASRQAVALKAESAEAHHFLAQAFGQQGNTDAALGELREALRLDNNDATHDSPGVASAQEGHFKAATEEYKKAVQLKPEMALAQHHLGLSLLRLGDAAGARAAFERAHQLDPTLANPPEPQGR